MRSSTSFRIFLVAIIVIPAFLNLGVARAEDNPDQNRIEKSGQVISEIMEVPDSIPQRLLARVDCLTVIPSARKIDSTATGLYRSGVMTCRSGWNFRGSWGPPTMMTLEEGSLNLEPGRQTTDFVLLVMNPRSARSILANKGGLGGDVSVAAGPLGNDPDTAMVTSRAEVLTYSHSRGLFMGVSLEGSALHPDNDANMRIYQQKLNAKEVALHHEVIIPKSAELLIHTLDQHTPVTFTPKSAQN